jgi:hypothetical protein
MTGVVRRAMLLRRRRRIVSGPATFFAAPLFA